MSNSTAIQCQPLYDETEMLDKIYQLIDQDIACLSLPSVELVAGLLSVQHSLPRGFLACLLRSLSRRVDLQQVSPAAEAAMTIGVAYSSSDERHELQFKKSAFALICALQKERYLDEAIRFLSQLSVRLGS